MLLPSDVLIEIFSHCSLKDIYHLRLINKTFNRITNMDPLWIILFEKTFSKKAPKNTTSKLFWYYYAKDKLVNINVNNFENKSKKRLFIIKYRIIEFKLNLNRVSKILIPCRNSYERKQAHQIAFQLNLYHESRYDPIQKHFNRTLIPPRLAYFSSYDPYLISSTPISYVLISKIPIKHFLIKLKEKPETKTEIISDYGSSIFRWMDKMKSYLKFGVIV